MTDNTDRIRDLIKLVRKQKVWNITYNEQLLKEAAAYCEDIVSDFRQKYQASSGGWSSYSTGTLFRMAEKLVDWGADSEIVAAAFFIDARLFGLDFRELDARFGEKTAYLAWDYNQFRQKTISLLRKETTLENIQYEVSPGAVLIGAAKRIEDFRTYYSLNEDKKRSLVENTDILISLLRQQNAFGVADELEDLYFQFNEADLYESIRIKYRDLYEGHKLALQDAREALEACLHWDNAYSVSLGMVEDIVWNRRNIRSIYRNLPQSVRERKKNVGAYITPHYVPLVDLTIILRSGSWVDIDRTDKTVYFFELYRSVLQKLSPGFLVITAGVAEKSDSVPYFVLRDKYGNRIRVFLRTEEEYRRFFVGTAEDSKMAYTFLYNENSFYYRNRESEEITVMDANGRSHQCRHGSTALDFAFILLKEEALHLESVRINDNDDSLLQTRLEDGDQVILEISKKACPDLDWFKCVHTEYAKDCLIKYFETKIIDINGMN